jgi:hypothetical protein
MAKVKLSLCLTKHHAMKTYWGSGGRAPCRDWMELTLDRVQCKAVVNTGVSLQVPYKAI